MNMQIPPMGSSAANVLYEKDDHACISFSTLVEGHGVQANQFLIVDGDHAALIDPGGDLTYTPLSIEISKRVKISELDFIFASHQDPDIIASLPRWMTHSHCKVVSSKLWGRFLPHLASSFMSNRMSGNMDERMIQVPDKGLSVDFGRSSIKCLPAHFLHSVGNINFYDPVSKILFSGDMGASIVDGDASKPVSNFSDHLQYMQGFHQRYMASNKACRLWANMIRQMDIRMIVPQHGNPFVGPEMIGEFLNWISGLSCGIDLMDETNFMPVR